MENKMEDYKPRILNIYENNIKKHFINEKYNVHQIIKLEKIVVNSSLNYSNLNEKNLQSLYNNIALLTGQNPVYTIAKNSNSGFHIRENSKLGCKVTLRNYVMYEFLDKLINVVFPRIKDFNFFSKKSFDKYNNFNIGIHDSSVFTEVDAKENNLRWGINITFVFKAVKKEDILYFMNIINFPIK